MEYRQSGVFRPKLKGLIFHEDDCGRSKIFFVELGKFKGLRSGHLGARTPRGEISPQSGDYFDMEVRGHAHEGECSTLF